MVKLCSILDILQNILSPSSSLLFRWRLMCFISSWSRPVLGCYLLSCADLYCADLCWAIFYGLFSSALFSAGLISVELCCSLLCCSELFSAGRKSLWHSCTNRPFAGESVWHNLVLGPKNTVLRSLIFPCNTG